MVYTKQLVTIFDQRQEKVFINPSITEKVRNTPRRMSMLFDDGQKMILLEDTYHVDEMARLLKDRWWWTTLNYKGISKRRKLLQFVNFQSRLEYHIKMCPDSLQPQQGK